MNMKKIGFWQETGYPTMPSIYSCIDKERQKQRKLPWFVFFYIVNSPRLSTTMSAQESIIDGTMIPGDIIRTDGVWVWSDSIVYYYEHHGLIIPKEFLKHVKKRLIPYPWFFNLKRFLLKRRTLSEITESLIRDFSEEIDKKRE